MTSYGAALTAARAALRRAGSPSAGLDARLLMAAAAGLDMAALIARDREDLPPLVERTFSSHLQRRVGGEPVARILGEREFWGLPFEVGPATLVPRPETETVVAAALAEARGRARRDLSICDLSICDLGTGSGAILLALLSELPEATGVGVDISPGALSIARRNAERLGVGARATFVLGDYLTAPQGRFDMVVANPPYVGSAIVHTLEREVRDYDPHLALDGGADGLAAYRTIAGRAAELLEPDGFIALEIGHGQDEAVLALIRTAGLADTRVHRDLSGIARVVAASRCREADKQGAKKALGKA